MSEWRGQSDDQLLVAAGGDRAALAAFYRRYEVAVLAYFVRRVDEPELAADLTAEVFAAALVACRRYRPGQAPAEAWLFAIARHKLVDSLRRGRVEDHVRRRLGMAALELTDDDIDRINQLSTDGELATRLLDELPAEQRDAILARVVQERPYPEIAARLECSQSVVRKRVSRGLASLRGRLGKELE